MSKALFQTFCEEANMRVTANLNTLRDPVQLKGFKSMGRFLSEFQDLFPVLLLKA